MDQSADRPLSFWMKVARNGFERDLWRLMKKTTMSRSQLAQRLNVSGAFVSKMLNGNNNYTLKTMARVARALGAVLEIRIAAETGEVVRVMDTEVAARLESRRDSQVVASAADSTSNLANFALARTAKMATLASTTKVADINRGTRQAL
jgi:transcriptional regulator with XRE-family HTH domain